MKNLLLITFVLVSMGSFGQKSFNDYVQFYPISEEAYIRLMSSYTKQESILLDANPIVRYSLFNDFLKHINTKTHTQAWYVSFRPQVRIYTSNSLPVRMPSYRILLGTQHMYRLTPADARKAKFVSFSFESGHYSNGQDGSAFSELYADGSPESDSIYRTITSHTKLSEILNRKNANFSTNLSELILNYRINQLDDDNLPHQTSSFSLGYVLYHDLFWGIFNFGGYSDNDIKMYGRHRFLGSYEFMKVFEKDTQKRYTIKQNIEWIHRPHASVNPLRLETIVRVFPFKNAKGMGFMLSYVYGHDNYNFRFVDSGHQIALGLTWDCFPPFTMGKLAD